MPTHRRSRRKSIAGNITDVQKRLRFLETRPAPSKIASKAVATKNIALRAVETELIADASITTRTVGQAQITNFTLSSVTDPSGPAVDTQNIAPLAVENAQLAGNISDDKISGMSTSKLIGTITNAQLAGSITEDKIVSLPTTKLTGTITNAQLAGSITEDKIVSLPTTKLTGTITNAQLAGSISNDKLAGGITNDKIVSLPTTKLTGTITNAQLADNSVTSAKISPGSVVEASIGSGAVTAVKIGTGAVTNQGLGVGAVLESRIFDGAVTEAKIRAGAVTTLKIGLGAVTNAQLAGSITSDKITSLAASKVTGTLDLSAIPGSVLTNVTGGTGITVSGSGRSRTITATGSGITSITGGNAITVSGSGSSRTIAVTPNTFATSGHGHGRVDTSFAGGHVGHGGHTHFSNITSSRKLKKEISDYDIDINKLFLLQPKKFKYKNQARLASKNREWDYGYIAEEALSIGVEEIVGYDEKGEVDSINYGLLSVFVLEIVKKQQNEIDLLKQEIERLKEKI